MTDTGPTDGQEPGQEGGAPVVAEAERARIALAIERRTRALAAPARGLDDAEHGRLLVFHRAGERFGVALDRVAAVITVDAVVPVPGADAPVRGVVAWRSRPVAAYDLAGGDAPVRAPATIVVVGDWRRAVALLADTVDDVVAQDAAAEARDAAPATTALIRTVSGDATAIVDADAVLSLFAHSR